MIISKLIPIIGGIAAEVAAVFSVILYILATKETTVILTFGNAKDKIECKVGVNIVIHFLSKNAGNVAARNVEALICYPKGMTSRSKQHTA